MKRKKKNKVLPVLSCRSTLSNQTATFFVYPKNGEAFVIHGGATEVIDEIREMKIACVINVVGKGKKRKDGKSLWFALGLKDGFYSAIKPPEWRTNSSEKKRKRASILVVTENTMRNQDITTFESQVVLRKFVRRIPRGWIEELNPFVKEEYLNNSSEVEKPPKQEPPKLLNISEEDLAEALDM